MCQYWLFYENQAEDVDFYFEEERLDSGKAFNDYEIQPGDCIEVSHVLPQEIARKQDLPTLRVGSETTDVCFGNPHRRKISRLYPGTAIEDRPFTGLLVKWNGVFSYPA